MAEVCTKCLLMLINRLRNLDMSEGQRLKSALFCSTMEPNRELLLPLQVRPAQIPLNQLGYNRTLSLSQSLCVCLLFKEERLECPLKKKKHT